MFLTNFENIIFWGFVWKILSSTEPEYDETIFETFLKDFSNKEYERVIDLITNNYKPNQKTIIETSHSYYSLEKGVEKYKEVYQEILGE